MIWRKSMTLDELQVGKDAVIQSVGGEGALRRHFLDMGLIPGTEVTLMKVAPMGDPVELKIRGYELTLRKADAARIASRPRWKLSRTQPTACLPCPLMPLAPKRTAPSMCCAKPAAKAPI